MSSGKNPSALTYPEVGATSNPSTLPQGYQHLRAQRTVGNGRDLFEECAATIQSWGIQSASGMKVETPGSVLQNSQNRLLLRWGPFKTWVVCQVVYVVDEPNRKGFAYGTLPGHPERGEECFIVSISDAGQVTFDVTAFSQPARWFARLGGPSVRWLQQHMTWRYLDAIHAPKVKRHHLLAATIRSYSSPDKSAWVQTSNRT